MNKSTKVLLIVSLVLVAFVSVAVIFGYATTFWPQGDPLPPIPKHISPLGDPLPPSPK